MKGFRAVGEVEFLLSVWSTEFEHRHYHMPISVKPPVGGFVVLRAENREPRAERRENIPRKGGVE